MGSHAQHRSINCSKSGTAPQPNPPGLSLDLCGSRLASEVMNDEAIETFWRLARRTARIGTLPGYFGPSTLEVVTPPAWSFGADPEQADRLLQLVLDGTKTATASARDDYDPGDEPLPQPGTMGIVLDGRGRPRALVTVTQVEVVPFDQVDAEHARAEGESSRELAEWRRVHEAFYRENDPYGRGFRIDMPVVLERFRVLYQT